MADFSTPETLCPWMEMQTTTTKTFVFSRFSFNFTNALDMKAPLFLSNFRGIVF